MTSASGAGRDRRRAFGLTLAATTAILAAVATLTPSSAQVTWSPWCLACGDLSTIDLVLNFLMFVPLGVGLALGGVSRAWVVAIAVAYSLSIEALQVQIITGRDASLGDLLMNSLGGAAGAFLAPLAVAAAAPSRRHALPLLCAWCATIILIQSVATAGMAPAPTSLPYYGQLGRALGGRPPYPGVVGPFSVGGEPIPNTSFDARVVRNRLAEADGAEANVTVFSTHEPSWFAAVARIVDERRREQLLIARDGSDAILAVRTRAAAIRLRPIRVRLPDAFGPVGSEPVRISGRYGRRNVTLSAAAPGRTRATSVTLSPGQTWRMLSPFYADASGRRLDYALGFLWIGALTLPLGYWAAATLRLGSDRTRIAAALATVGAVALVCAGVPAIAGTPLARWTEWLATVVGASTGYAAFVGAVSVRDRTL